MNTLFLRLLRANVAVLLIAILVVGVSLSYLYTRNVYESRTQELVGTGRQIAEWVVQGRSTAVLRPRLEGISQALSAFIIIVNPANFVELTTDPRLDQLRLTSADADRVLRRGEVVTRRGYEASIGQTVVTAVVPVRNNGTVLGAVILYSPVGGTAAVIRQGQRILSIAVVLAVVVGIVMSYAVSRRLAAPIHEMTAAAGQMTRGDFTRRVRVRSDDELGVLGSTLNELAARLGETVGELTEEKQKTDSILAGISEGVIAADREGTIILANPSVDRLLPVEGGLTGRSMRSEPLLAPLWPAFKSALEEGAPRYEPEVRWSGRVFSLSVAPLRHDGGPAHGAVGILHDVSERYELERMRREFLANVSHELRTPLTSIRGFAQAILDGVVTDEEQSRRYLQVIMDESLRLIRLSNTLLDLSRIQARAVKLTLGRVHLEVVAKDVIETLEPHTQERGVSVVTDFPPLPPITADEDRIAQVFVNLIENAVRHSPRHSRVVVRAELVDREEEGPRVAVFVEDSGPGIPEEELEHVWERFYKVDKSRRSERGVGTGLGLVIVKELVELHGGEVGAANRPEGGAVFWIELPVAAPATGASETG